MTQDTQDAAITRRRLEALYSDLRGMIEIMSALRDADHIDYIDQTFDLLIKILERMSEDVDRMMD